jgi:hypothetical protein
MVSRRPLADARGPVTPVVKYRWLAVAGVTLALACGAACRQDMHDQPKYIPLRPSQFFGDGRSERPLLDDTVARGHLNDDALLHTGKGPDGKFSAIFPFPVTSEVLQTGRVRFDTYCAPCHDRLGNGLGMIVRRGYRRPPSYHIERLRAAAPGYMFDVITRGFGAMPDYAAQVAVPDRWAIVAYVKTLQFSQNASINDVPAAERGRLGTPGEQQGGGAK